MKKLILALIFLSFIKISYAQSPALNYKYRGFIGITNQSINMITNFEFKNDQITGNYKYGATVGEFKNCKLEGHALNCDWVEPKNSKGLFEAIFNDNLDSFIAVWYYESGAYGGAWTGHK